MEERDQATGSLSVITDYTYEGTPAWHHDDDEFLGSAPQTWSDWRGYGTALVNVGGSRTRYRIYRGMNGDRTWEPPGTRSVQISSLDGSFTAPDDDWLTGLVLEEAQVNAALTRITSTLTEHQAVRTIDRPAPYDDAYWVGERHVTETRRTPTAGLVQRRTTTTVDARYRPVQVLEEGWLDTTGDERCTRTTYAENPTASLHIYPATQVLVAGDCTSTSELHRTEWHYDGGALNAAPTRGNVTQTRDRRTSSAWGGYTTTAYDTLGRPTSVTDALNRTTTTGYTPAMGVPATTTITNAENQTSSTTWQPERGLPLEQEDPNGNVTTYGYDALGREERVWLPTEQPAGPGVVPSVTTSYTVDENKVTPVVVRTRRSLDGTGTRFQDSWTLYDGFLRERQSQALSPATGSVIVATTGYDARGNVATAAQPEAVTGTAGGGILTPAGGASWANETMTTYDSVNRPVNTEYYVDGTEDAEATTAYTHNSSTVLPPRGGATLTVTDAYDRTVQIAEQTERGGTSWDETDYAYDLADNLTSVTDPAGNEITYTYDMLGQRVTQSDPDAGDWSFTYDAVGNQASTTDARGTTIHTLYDQLNRPIERRRDSATGPRLASWAYDAPGEAGLLDSSTRHTTGGDWTIDVTGYDPRGRTEGTTWTVPAGIPGLSGSYTVTHGYDGADHMTSVNYPAVGGVAAETVTTDYSTLGLPTGMTGLDDYVGVALYDDRGRPGIFGYGDAPGGTDFSMGRYRTYDADQRPETTTTAGHGGQLVSEDTLAYDDNGNVTERTSDLNGNEFRECYTYDDRNRLTHAITTADLTSGDACDNTSSGPTGDLAYEESYSYSADGNLLSRTQGTQTLDYTYPTGTNPDRPHAPTDVEGNAYEWDANGHLESRTIDGNTDTFTWDPERRLESITTDAGTASFTYDPSGQRLLHETPDGDMTLYLAGHEITAANNGATVEATRSYTFAGELIATRTAAGIDYLGVNEQGSIQTEVQDGQPQADAAQAYTPYGQRRTTDDFTTQRGWIGQFEDDDIGLNYLNARYYDPNLGTFISPDPVLDPNNPQTVNPYAYGLNNPTSGSDPSGLATCGGGGKGKKVPRWVKCPTRGRNPRCKYKCPTGHGGHTPRCKYKCTTSGGGGGGGGGARPTGGGGGGGTRNFGGSSGGTRRTGPICWCHPSWANPLVQISGFPPHVRQALMDINTLHHMRLANRSIGFWVALDRAGSAQNLIAAGERQVLLNLREDASRSQNPAILASLRGSGSESPEWCTTPQHSGHPRCTDQPCDGGPMTRTSPGGGIQHTMDCGGSWTRDPGNPSPYEGTLEEFLELLDGATSCIDGAMTIAPLAAGAGAYGGSFVGGVGAGPGAVLGGVGGALIGCAAGWHNGLP